MRFIIVSLFIGLVVNPFIGLGLLLLVAIPNVRRVHQARAKRIMTPAQSEQWDTYFAKWSATNA